MSKSDWLAHRRDGIGCSEVATIMGLNPYQSSIELFYDKLGEVADKPVNAAMFMGNYLEDCIADLFQYWETDMATMMANYEAGKKVSKVRRINSILTSERYPWLLGNLDREIYFPTKAVLEIKTISGYALDMWASGIPVMYIMQVQAYMMLTGYSESKLAILKDGRTMEVYTVGANEDIMGGIEESCSAFWQRVVSAKILKESGKPFESMEPDVDNTVAYEKFMKEKFKQSHERSEVGDDLYQVALKYTSCNDEKKSIEEKQQGFKNELISAMRNNDLMSFGIDKGYCSLKENSNGTKVFLCKVKKQKEGC